ncbi:MAG TPA: 50S ribosomal protein L15e [archaeon]|nr:50S ribosomal protein L15e [archaeon]
MFYKKISKEKKRIDMTTVVERVDKPADIKRARRIGYKAKQGFTVARVRIKKGMRRRPSPTKGRKPGNIGVFFTQGQSKQAIAEKRAARKFPNLEVLNSYAIGETGTHKFYDVIMIDKHHAVIKKDPQYKWLENNRKRVFRGRTSAGQKSRGLQ